MTQPELPEDAGSQPNAFTYFTNISIIFPVISAILIFSVYLLGFVVFNVHISEYGYFLNDVFSPRSVIAGLVFFFYIACFSAFAGRYAVLARTQVAEDIAFLRSLGCGTFWQGVKFAESQIKIFVFLALSTLFFCSFTVATEYDFLILVVMALWFLIIYPMDVANWDLSKPRLFVSVSLAHGFTVITTLAYVLVKDENFRAVALSYFGIFVVLNMVLDSFERYRITRDRVFYTVIFASIFLLSTAAGFGALVYDRVSYRIGGGTPVKADLYLGPDAGDKMGMSDGELARASIYYMEDNLIVLKSENEVVYLVKGEDIRLLRLYPEKIPTVGERLTSFLVRAAREGNKISTD